LADIGLPATQIEALILKFLLNQGTVSGRTVAAQIALPFGLIQRVLFAMKEQQLVSLKSDAPLGDYGYELTAFGAEHGRRYVEQCTYFGTAPVPFDQYAASVVAQSPARQPLDLDVVKRAFHDLVLDDDVLGTIGESLNLGRGMFLHGAAGNGKSSIGERLTRVFGSEIWIPRTLSVGGEIVRLFDSIHHRQRPEVHADSAETRPYDRRWVRITRPTIVMGGELELNSFDITANLVTGINEAPLQLKANCGTLVIDDFGRNRFRPAELLNRLVVPLERGVDAFHLPSGRTFHVPIECMLVLASNDVPADLVDEAFLRRIPFKIAIGDPTEEQFKQLYLREAERHKLQTNRDDVEYLLARHYRHPDRPLRFCHARDLLRMIANALEFHGQPRVVTHDAIDRAVQNYVSLKTGTAR
jgi:predicted ATPase with chaperone activity